MADSNPSQNTAVPAKEAGQSLYEGTLNVLMTGVAIIVPFVITLYVLNLAVGFVANALHPFVELLKWMGAIRWFQEINFIRFLIELDVYPYVIDFLGELIAVIVLFVVVLVAGSLGRNRYGEHVIRYIDLGIASVPGVGTVYESFRRMGDVMLDGGSENFREVRLVECLGDELYMLGFETGRSPDSVGEATDHEDMVTMFLPLAPNPVTGGFLAYVPKSRVYDVDMTVDEGIRSILTSGVATDEGAAGTADGSLRDIGTVADIESLREAVPGAERVRSDGDESGPPRPPADADGGRE